MLGKHHIVIETDRLKYEFDIKRNITVVQGDSATGKTTLVSLCETYSLYHEFYPIYESDNLIAKGTDKVLLVEDQKSGFQFFCKTCHGVECISASGNSNITVELLNISNTKLSQSSLMGLLLGPLLMQFLKSEMTGAVSGFICQNLLNG